jgi:cellulose synthase/poly-beta-1,6-N-acetylglucosamine synthase-like glycosyltransferase
MDYLRVGRASELEDPRERRLLRFFEIFQGGLSWLTLGLAFVLSGFAPTHIFYFLIVFVIFWFFQSLYYAFHLHSGFKKMRKYEKVDWLEKIKQFPIEKSVLEIKSWRDIYHLIIFPNYNEPYEVIKESLEALVDSDYPKDRMIVVVAFEQRGGEERKVIAQKIKQEFGDKFFKFLNTFHPDGIVGEIKGKGANDAWACKKAKELIIDPLAIPYENIIVSSFDIDTRVYPKYFSCLTYHYLTAQKPTRTSFQPIPLYHNNIWEAPAFSQVSSFAGTFWQIMCQERPEKLITFSSSSMSFQALVEVGFKQTNIVSEDSRIFWQCFFKFDGNYRTQPIFYPVSMDANVGKNIWQTLRQMYKQKRRWAYGVENVSYFLYGCVKNKRVPLKKKLSLGFELIGGQWSWAVSSILIFVLGWLPIFLGGRWFSHSLLSYSVPKMASRIMTFAMIGLITSIWLSSILLPPRPPVYKKTKYLAFVLSWILIPAQMIFLNSLPALDAQTRFMLGKYMGFWVTPKQRKKPFYSK